MKIIAIVLFFAICFTAKAQEVNYNGTTYKIKGKTILREGADVTTTLSAEDQTGVWNVFNKEKALIKERKVSEKAIKKAERDQKKAEKKQKKAEKELKGKQKAQSKFEKSGKDYNKAVAKYENLKERGKLSTDDEAKWLKKIENLKNNLDKAKKKL
jgi:hypothetical protein